MNFSELQHALNQAITQSRGDMDYALQRGNQKLQLSDAFFCGEDIVKNTHFFEALKLAIRDLKTTFPNEEIRVIDAGSGTGILGILALLAGADEVLFIEANSETLAWSKNFIKSLGFENKSQYTLGDATDISLDTKYHLLISETLTIDFKTEDFQKIIQNLKQFLFPEALIIPESCEICFTQTDVNKKILSKNSISRNFLENISSHIEVLDENTEYLEIHGTLGLYKNMKISSGESVSLFNTLRIHQSQLGDEYIWGSEE